MSKQLHRIYAVGECSENSKAIRVSANTYISIRTLAKEYNMNIIDVVYESVKLYKEHMNQRKMTNE